MPPRNGFGHLHSFDIVDHVVRNLPEDVVDRWTFNEGNVRKHRELVPNETDYLFIDAAHTAWLARWYIAELFPAMPPKIPVSVHDVFHGRRAFPFTEGATVLRWLDRANIPFFTASAAEAPEVHRQLNELNPPWCFVPITRKNRPKNDVMGTNAVGFSR